MNIPNLSVYRSEYEAAGLSLPLSPVKKNHGGLLSVLPKAAAEKKGWPWTTETDVKVFDSNINWPKITVVTPSFNQGVFIEQTIRSVLLQNYPNLEYIIIDGGSKDETQAIIEKYAPWLSYQESRNDRGQGHAINKGFSIASGQYYTWINSDDYFLENVLHKVAYKFLTTKAKFIYGYGYSYNTATNTFLLVKVPPVLDFFLKIPSIIQPSTFWTAAINQPIWEDLYCSLDFELWLRIARGNRKLLIKEPLSVANGHDMAKTFNPEMKHKWDDDEKKIWAADAHGPVPHWHKVNFINRIRLKLLAIFKLI
ncbi:glycosyltransferase [Pedobacter sp. G11]|uniref:glycosyltransferase family 2 protein n=1 Tax=Pedobacter sp. G11 TaxID=2482728 RepID=UPI000F5FE26E|nr:glycosyltransferase family 2 protein [Pedobacter sp. G11]AZI25846.1 glycosyltransferase [Pedobacter sp. G11]